MGAWAEYTFGNDAAGDWIYTFLEAPSLTVVQETFQQVLSEADYLDSWDACSGLAACEVIARLQGNWGVRNGYSEDLDRWIESNPMTIISPTLKAMANDVIERVLGANSELQELWDEDGRNDAWHNEVEDLRQRVQDI